MKGVPGRRAQSPGSACGGQAGSHQDNPEDLDYQWTAGWVSLGWTEIRWIARKGAFDWTAVVG